MGGRRQSRRQVVVGIDIGSSAVRAAVLSVVPGHRILEKVGQVALPAGAVRDGQVVDGPAVTRSLRDLRSGLGIRSKRAVLGCEQLRSFVRDVELPWVPLAQRVQALPLLAADMLPMAPDDAVTDFVELADYTGDGGARIMRGLLVAASAEALMAQIMAAESAGFRVERVDLAAFALVRSLSEHDQGSAGDGGDVGAGRSAGAEALVDIGAGVTTVVIHQGGIPRFVRLLPPTEQGAMERLVEDIRSSLDYYLLSDPDLSLSRIALTGGWASPDVASRLGRVAKAPVVMESAFRNVELAQVGLAPDQLQVMSATGAVCIGLAMGEAA